MAPWAARPDWGRAPSPPPWSPTNLQVQVCYPAVVKVSDSFQNLPQISPDLALGEVSPSHHTVQETPLVSPAGVGRRAILVKVPAFLRDLSSPTGHMLYLCPTVNVLSLQDSTST